MDFLYLAARFRYIFLPKQKIIMRNLVKKTTQQTTEKKQAQCCAKLSKNQVGCHD